MVDYFSPGTTVALSVAAASVSANINPDSLHLRLCNSGGSMMWIVIGLGPQTATQGGYPLLGDTTEVITKPAGADTIAAISTGGATTLYVTSGMAAEGS